MPLHAVKRGLDIPVMGAASGSPVELEKPKTIAYSPREFRGVIPRLAAREGDAVQAGSPLFYSKSHPEMKFLSPVSGRVKEIRRGRRRVIIDVVVEVEGDLHVEFPQHTAASIDGMSREDAAASLLSSGLWGALRTRPLSLVPQPGTVPQSILIGAMESGPLQAGADALVDAGDAEALQAGVNLLKKLTDGKVFIARRAGHSHAALDGLQGVESHEFKGPHPAGDPAVQVNFVDPPRGSNRVWTIRAWDVALIGRFLLEGRFPAERTYAVVGAGVKTPRYVKTVLGAPLAHIAGETNAGPHRWIRGSVLTGEAVDGDRWAAFGARTLHVLPDQVDRELFGWWRPSLTSFSAHRAFLSGFIPLKKEYDLRPGIWGGHRGMVPVNQYRKVTVTPDIHPEFLIRAIVANDLEEMISLGLLDFTEEEAALCSYIDPCKIEVDVLLQQGLDRYIEEAGA